MPRGIWKGHISFGLVNIPVVLHPAEKREELNFDLLDKRDFAPIGYRKVNNKTVKEVPKEDIVRGFEYRDGQYVIVNDEDLRRASPERTQRVEIRAFVDADEIDPTFFDQPYYLEPSPKHEKAYALLREALKKSGKVGIATVVIRSRQYLAALMPQDSLLVLNLLRYSDELRDPNALSLPKGNAKALGISENEMKMAERLIDEMVEPWNPEKYKDEYEKELLAFIRRKGERGATEEVEKAEQPRRQRGEVVDIMSLLKRSVEEADGTRKRPRKKTA